jgi:hypothetical protein
MNLPADFSDRLSPMLVKELRQGMRTNLFTAAFILLQVFMVLSLMIGAAFSGGGEDASGGFFWMFIIVTLLGVMPVRGFSALHKENQINTMDLIQLTRLSAWRITWGKWLALASQTLLLVTAVLPYIVLRYYLGGINFVAELLALLMITLTSMTFTAVTVGFSAFPSVLLRGAVAVGLLFLIFGLGINSFMFTAMGGRSIFDELFGASTRGEFWWGLFALVITMTYICYFFLDLGASRIAPESANHATRKRLIGFAYVLLALTLPLVVLSIPSEVLASMAVIVLLAVWTDAITEKAALVPSIFRPFRRKSLYRPWISFLTPGWHTGVRFMVLSGAIALLLIGINPDLASSGLGSTFFDVEFLTFCFSIVGILLFPLMIILLFFHAVTFSRYFFGLYVMIQVCTWLFTAMISAVSETTRNMGEILYYLVPIPSVVFVASESAGAISEGYLLVAAIVGVVLCLIVCTVRSRLLFKKMHLILRDLKAENGEAGSAPNAPTDLTSPPTPTTTP